MKRRRKVSGQHIRRGLQIILLCTVFASLSQATSVSNCFLDTVGVSCYTQGMFSFNDSLDWGAATSPTGQSGFGTAFASSSNPHNTYDPGNGSAITNPWLARTTNGINVTATIAPSFSGGSPTLVRADNTRYVWNSNQIPADQCPEEYPCGNFNAWDTTTSGSSPAPGLQTFAGHFAGIDPNTKTGSDSNHPYGDHLLGGTSGGPIELAFDKSLAEIGFNIASKQATDFMATLTTFFNNAQVNIYTVRVTAGGGVCATLSPGSPNSTAPVPCGVTPGNAYGGDAAFVGIGSPTSRFDKILINTDDPNGLYINGLTLAAAPEAVPEPGMMGLVGAALAAICIVRRRARRNSRGTSNPA